jgi:hypothetical protein
MAGGRILLFGSAARGEMTEFSDVAILIDVPEAYVAEAWAFAERLSDQHREETRRFRHKAARGYSSFDPGRAAPAIDAARRPAAALPSAIREFEQRVSRASLQWV